MLELQEYISEELDKGRIVGTYSLDLSAAFDLLQPDIFYTNLREIIEPGLMNTLMDFLSGRKFQVEVDGKRSKERVLRVGCVQGSILGPKLFTLYMRSLPEKIGNAHIITYADDTYVSLSSTHIEELRQQMVTTMETHDDYLQTVGMVTNVAKTEVTIFSRKPVDCPPLVVKGATIHPTPHLKVLGIKFSSDLTWDHHIKELTKKAKFVIKKLKYLSRLLDMSSMKKIVTSHFFGLLYYSAAVWMNDLTTWNQWRTLDSLHYRALRVCAKDYYNRISKVEINKMFDRATPHEWMRYTNSNIAINLYLLGEHGPPLSQKLIMQAYINDRNPGVAIVMDTSRLRIGKHAFTNRLQCLKNVRFDWTRGITKDKLRIALKHTFFSYLM